MDKEIGLELNKTAQLYNERYKQFGRDIKTVGWGSQKDQILRFQMLFLGIDARGKKILDVGCGLADLIPFLDEITEGKYEYIGIDIAENLVNDAQRMFDRSNCNFFVGDIHAIDLPPVDISVLSGALSFKLPGLEEYAFRTMEKMFNISKEAACLNFLSTYVDYQLDKNQHYQPEVVFSQASSITKWVNLFHAYPLPEFTIQLFQNK